MNMQKKSLPVRSNDLPGVLGVNGDIDLVCAWCLPVSAALRSFCASRKLLGRRVSHGICDAHRSVWLMPASQRVPA